MQYVHCCTRVSVDMMLKLGMGSVLFEQLPWSYLADSGHFFCKSPPSDRKKTLPHLWGSHHQLDDKYSKPKKNSKIINIVGQLTSSLKDLSSKKKKSRNIFEKGRAGAEKYNVQRRAHPKSRCCENEEHCTLYVFGQVYRVWGSAVDVKRVTRVVPPHLPAPYFSNLYSPSSSSLPGNCFDLLTHISAHRKYCTWGGNNKQQGCNGSLNEI